MMGGRVLVSVAVELLWKRRNVISRQLSSPRVALISEQLSKTLRLGTYESTFFAKTKDTSNEAILRSAVMIFFLINLCYIRYNPLFVSFIRTVHSILLA
uniref:Ovule protein n=1 Tax=Parascaris univalens TaxID=6257 RepID=A0A915A2E2_PARUN